MELTTKLFTKLVSLAYDFLVYGDESNRYNRPNTEYMLETWLIMNKLVAGDRLPERFIYDFFCLVNKIKQGEMYYREGEFYPANPSPLTFDEVVDFISD